MKKDRTVHPGSRKKTRAANKNAHKNCSAAGYNFALSACDKSMKWQQALEMFTHLESKLLQANLSLGLGWTWQTGQTSSRTNLMSQIRKTIDLE